MGPDRSPAAANKTHLFIGAFFVCRGHRLDVVFDGKVGRKAAVFGRPGRVYIYSRYASMQDGQLGSLNREGCSIYL